MYDHLLEILTVCSASSVAPTTPLHHGEEERPEQTSEANPNADKRRRCEGGFGAEEEHPPYRDATSEKAEAAAEAAAAGSSGERDGRTRPSSSISEKESQTAGAAATAAAYSYRLELQVPTRWLCKP